MPAYKPSKLGQTDLVFGLFYLFIYLMFKDKLAVQ